MAVSSVFSRLMQTMGRPALDKTLNLYPHAIEIVERVRFVGDSGAAEAADDGDEEGLWRVFASAQAKLSAQAGSEFPTSEGQIQGGETVTFEMLYVEGVTTRMRVRHDGREYGVLATWSPGDRKVYTTIVARVLEPEHE